MDDVVSSGAHREQEDVLSAVAGGHLPEGLPATSTTSRVYHVWWKRGFSTGGHEPPGNTQTEKKMPFSSTLASTTPISDAIHILSSRERAGKGEGGFFFLSTLTYSKNNVFLITRSEFCYSCSGKRTPPCNLPLSNRMLEMGRKESIEKQFAALSSMTHLTKNNNTEKNTHTRGSQNINRVRNIYMRLSGCGWEKKNLTTQIYSACQFSDVFLKNITIKIKEI